MVWWAQALLAFGISVALGAAVVYFLGRHAKYTNSNRAIDLVRRLEALIAEGVVERRSHGMATVPRELKRKWLSVMNVLGKGQFGEVRKCLLNDKSNPHVPEYMVAAKIVRASGGQHSAPAPESRVLPMHRSASLMRRAYSPSHWSGPFSSTRKARY